MVLLKSTQNIEKAVELYKKLHKGVENGLEISIDNDGYIKHSDLIKLHNELKSKNNKEYEFDGLLQLLKGSAIDTRKQEPKRPKQTEEFKKQMEQLRESAKEQEYQNLIKNSEFSRTAPANNNNDDDLSPNQMMKEVKEQVTTIFNVLVSVGSVAWALWYWSGSSMGLGYAARTLMALFGALIVLIAEVVIYSRYKYKVDDARKTERKKKEHAKIISTTTFTSQSSPITEKNIKKKKSSTLRKRKA